MTARLLALAFAAATLLALAAQPARAGSAHDFSFTAIEGGALPLEKYAGKALLVVNTASFCGFTPQYEGLQALWDTYRERDFALLGVPSGDFGGQEYNSNGQIKEFCEVNFNIDFDMTEKTRVKGNSAHPFYKWAADALGAEGVPRWNFHKLLIAPDGTARKGFDTRVQPDDPELVAAIEALVGKH